MKSTNNFYLYSKCTYFTVCAFMLFLSVSFITNAQSITYEDLVKLQKSSLEKAKGFFSYKEFNFYSSEKNKDGVYYNNEYALTYDQIIWKKNSEEIQLLTKPGYENVIVYYTDKNSFSEIENDAKNNLNLSSSKPEKNMLQTVYKGQNLEFSFNIINQSKYYSNYKYYQICVDNYYDQEKIINQFCSYCKGKGRVTEYEKCRYCGGNGKENCDNCDGKGQLLCRYCSNGQNQCNKCWGKGTYQCDKCWGQGTYNCSVCYGNGTTTICPKCKGRGVITSSALSGYMSITSTCTYCYGKGQGNFVCMNCSGKRKLTCSECLGTGTLTCTSCSGTGKITCQHCNGIYSTFCTKCNGTGHTNLICSNCNGKGTTSEKIIKVCPVCNGSKLK